MELLFAVCVDYLSVRMIVVVGLKDRGLVSSPSPYAIVSRHDVSELLKRLEYVDAYPSVESSWLQHPEVLVAVAALGNLVGSLEDLLFGHLDFLYLLIDHRNLAVDILLNCLEDIQELLYFFADIVLQVVQNHGKRNHIIDV